MRRRQFAFWFGMGLFGLAETVRSEMLDVFAASLMDLSDKPKAPPANAETAPRKRKTAEHWAARSNPGWRWYERESLIDGEWVLTGVTVPLSRETGQPLEPAEGYLAESTAPASIRNGYRGKRFDEPGAGLANAEFRTPDTERRARHGLPPSQWLRSLRAAELSIWLKTIDVPPADVAGMTYFEHLTNDHKFDAEKIKGLAQADLAKLHAAAHFGY